MSSPIRAPAAELFWCEAFSVGHSGLDAEHQDLVRLINEYCLASLAERVPGELSVLLRAIELATREHLRHENEVLRHAAGLGPHAGRTSTNFQIRSEAERHIDHHRKLLGELAAISDDAEVDPYRDAHRAQLVAWFVDHAVKHDAHLKTILQSH